MTPDKIKHLRELRAKATPGPWKTHPTYSSEMSLVLAGDEKSVPFDNPAEGAVFTPEDAQLIAAAVNALPGLMDELEYYRDKYPATLERSIRDGLDNTSEARCTCGLLSDLCQCYRAGRIEVAQELDRYKKALEVAMGHLEDTCDWEEHARAVEGVDRILAGDE